MSKRKDNLDSLLKRIEEEQNQLKIDQAKFKIEQRQAIEKQNKKNKITFLYFMFFSLLFSGITSVASYSIGASSVEYTPRDSNWDVENTQEAIDDLFNSVGASLVGSVYSYMGVSAPPGYLACDGSTYNIEDYPRLANHINRSFGSYNYFGGDGTTTFAVPDLRGEFLRGTGTNSHTSQGSGATVGTHQDSTEIPRSYAGNGNNKQMGIANTDGRWDFWLKGQNLDSITSSNNNMVFTNGTYYSNSGATGTVRPTNTSVLYIIKY